MRPTIAPRERTTGEIIHLDAEWEKRQWKRQRRQSAEIRLFIERLVAYLNNTNLKKGGL